MFTEEDFEKLLEDEEDFKVQHFSNPKIQNFRSEQYIPKILHKVEDSDEEVEKYDFKNLPDHSCDYCGIHDPECVVKCNEKNCNKWFCNSKSVGIGSHIILHMVNIPPVDPN
jgi:hypothetical protein